MKALLMELLGNKQLLFAVQLRKAFKDLSNKDQAEYAKFLYDSFKWLSLYFHELFNNEKKELSLSQYRAYLAINDLYKKSTYRALQLKVSNVKILCSRRVDLERRLSKVNSVSPYSELAKAQTIIMAFQALVEDLAYSRKYSEQEISTGTKLGVIKLLRGVMKFETKNRQLMATPLVLGLPVFSDFEKMVAVKDKTEELPFVSVYPPDELKAITGKTAFGA